MKFYISFRPIHTHSLHSFNGVHTLDKDCILEMEAESKAEAQTEAMRIFSGKFHNCYDKLPDMSHFPRGVIKL